MTDQKTTETDWRDELERRYEPWFSQCAWGIAVDDGWRGLLEDLCERLHEVMSEAERAEFRVTQVKEKFGSLRFYTAATPRAAEPLIDRAEEVSARTCERCGGPGVVHAHRGWYRCLCTACSSLLRLADK